MTKNIYFASDFHLGSPNHQESRKREDRIVKWLNFITPTCSELFLMGDVFDFWFEYGKVIPKGFVRLQGKLAEMSDAGIKIYFFKGNHDMWVNDYFTKEIGLEIVSDELIIERGGKKFYLHHGDGLGPGDHGYKFMKKVFTFLFLAVFGLTQAQQAFKGKGDIKVNVGANLQDGGSGIQGSVDFGLGENFSFGFVTTYLLGVDNFTGFYHNNPTPYTDEKPEFQDRFDAKARINANLSSVIGVEQLDIYPGLSLGLHNFGGHVGGRYFFTEGFGVFTEIGFPIAKYSDNNDVFDHLNNQATFSLGASFNL